MEQRWHNIIRALLNTGMTQAQIANAIGVTQGAVSQVLNAPGKRGFSFTAGSALIRLHSQRCAIANSAADAHLIWPEQAAARGECKEQSMSALSFEK